MSIDGSSLMTHRFRPAIALALGLLVAACGGGGSDNFDLFQPPDTPGSLTAELTPDHESVLLRWTAPTPSDNRAPVTGYAVYLESTGGQAQRLGTTQSLSYRHTGLLSGVRYVFHVRALSAAGPSEPSASAFVDVPPVQSPPDSPGQPSVRLTPDNDALLTWTAPAASPDRSPVTGYAVFLESAGGQAQRLGVTGARSYLHSGLLPGESYVFHVRALSAVGPSEPSASASVDVPPGPTLPPEVPGSFAAELTPEHDALLRWEAPAPSADRAPVTRYQVYLESAGGVVRQIGVTRALSYLHSGLLPGRRYVFHVRAASDAGVSDPSASEYVDVPLGPSLLPPEPPGNFTAELSPNLEALLRWVPPTPSDDPDRAPVTGYRVYLEFAGGLARPLGDTQSLSYLHRRLIPGRRYVFHVRALSALGLSRASASAFIEYPPGVEIGVPHVTVRADDSDPGSTDQRVLISWTHRVPADPTVDPTIVTGFILQYCEIPRDHSNDNCPRVWMNHEDSPDDNSPLPATTRVVTDEFDCEMGTMTTDDDMARMYRMRALASNIATSRYSEPTRPICPSAGYSPPRRVEALFAVTTQPQQIANICWDTPIDNGSPLIGYELQVTPENNLPAAEDGWLVLDAYIGPGTSADPLTPVAPGMPVCRLYSGLAAQDERWFRVRAYNLAGHGHWSAPYHYRHGSGLPVSSLSASSESPGPNVSVSPASAAEDDRAGLVFTVSVTPAVENVVRVRYDTESGTAVAGRDFESASGVLEIPAGESGATVAIRLFDDEEIEGAETLVLWLSEPDGARIGRGEALGTINASDPTPGAWLARFGQSFTIGAVDAIRSRMAAASATDSFTPWVRIGARGFSSRDPYSEISGSIRLASLGLDRGTDRWHVGFGLTHGDGSGSHGDADFDSALVAVHPYASLHFDDRLTLWGAVGTGSGSVQVNWGAAADSADVSYRMGVLGARGNLLSVAAGDPFDLDWVADASWAEIDSSATPVLRSSSSSFSRLRSGVDLGHSLSLNEGSVFAPSLSLALVHDEGDAREGSGLDAELLLRYESPQHGLSANAVLSRLIASGEAGSSGWGVSGTLAYDPGAVGRGLSLSVSPRFGSVAEADRGPIEFVPSSEASVDAIARYGMGSSRWSPYAGLRLSDGAGYKAGFETVGAGGSSVRIEARTGKAAGIWSQGALRW